MNDLGSTLLKPQQKQCFEAAENSAFGIVHLCSPHRASWIWMVLGYPTVLLFFLGDSSKGPKVDSFQTLPWRMKSDPLQLSSCEKINGMSYISMVMYIYSILYYIYILVEQVILCSTFICRYESKWLQEIHMISTCHYIHRFQKCT